MKSHRLLEEKTNYSTIIITNENNVKILLNKWYLHSRFAKEYRTESNIFSYKKTAFDVKNLLGEKNEEKR